jgi:hypothetical protein
VLVAGAFEVRAIIEEKVRGFKVAVSF